MHWPLLCVVLLALFSVFFFLFCLLSRSLALLRWDFVHHEYKIVMRRLQWVFFSLSLVSVNIFKNGLQKQCCNYCYAELKSLAAKYAIRILPLVWILRCTRSLCRYIPHHRSSICHDKFVHRLCFCFFFLSWRTFPKVNRRLLISIKYSVSFCIGFSYIDLTRFFQHSLLFIHFPLASQ